MELNQIRYFLAACQSLNFTRAAEACDVAVPTLTRAIQRLEKEVGGQLFRRERHLTHMTDLGRLMQGHLSDAQQATTTAMLEAARYARADTRLKIGVITSISAAHLVAFLRELQAQAPDLSIDIWESHCADVAQALENNEIDIAIISLPEYPETLRAVELYRELYTVAFAPGHRYGEMSQVPLRELEGEDYIKRTHCEFPSNFVKLGIAMPYENLNVRYTTEREDWVQSMVAAGLGMTVMPKYLLLLDGIETRPIIEPEVTRTISVVTKAGRRHTVPVKLALDTARDMDWNSVPV